MMHLHQLRPLTRLVLLGLLVVSGGCGGERRADEKQPEHVETIGFMQGLSASFTSRGTAPQFTNNTKFDLTDLDLTITFTASSPNVKAREEKVRWESWRQGEKCLAASRRHIEPLTGLISPPGFA